ncbi:MAG: aminotransferase class I/II-fold pyridoxal phosphate-dependent enzyme [Planctomycetes bacterium]|nr:aminotransferase class I/II-fold pyridoxal phosphate-dependent enzyme [Planctomycetota bacterium]
MSSKMAGILPSDIRKYTSIVEERGGINLAQGHCFIEPLEAFSDLFAGTMAAFEKGRSKSGYTTYVHASGIQLLLNAIAKKLQEFNNVPADPDMLSGNIVVTHGATGAMSCALDALVDPGTEVILFEPLYNYHLKAVQMKGGIPKFVQLKTPNWDFDPAELEQQITEKTRAIIINTPNNPTGKVFSRVELEAVADICKRKDIFAITDEVYEFITFDGTEHLSLASLPGMAERTVTISSYSKTLAATGIRMGYAVAPKELAQRIRVANEVNYICAVSPIQHALVQITENWERFLSLSKTFGNKRQILAEGLSNAGFKINLPKGSYYILADFTKLGFSNDVVAVEQMIDITGVGAVPGSAFYSDDAGSKQIRFCFANRDEQLIEASKLLRQLYSGLNSGESNFVT